MLFLLSRLVIGILFDKGKPFTSYSQIYAYMNMYAMQLSAHM